MLGRGEGEMIVCEYEFDRPDPKNPSYSLVEVDFYGWFRGSIGVRFVIIGYR